MPCKVSVPITSRSFESAQNAAERSRPVPRHAWSSFLRSFSRRHQGWLITVDARLRPGATGGGDRWRPLQAIDVVQTATGEAAIAIRFGDSLQPRASVVRQPSGIQLELTESRAERGLLIADRRGRYTGVRFRTAPPPETVDGIAPGEL